MKTAVAYCRVSTDKEEQKKSIRSQQKEWEQYFADAGNGIESAKNGFLYKRDGTNRVLKNGLYVDEGISGTSLRNRFAFQRMIEDAKKGLYNYIFVEDVSRFGRSTEDGIKIIKDLREIGVLVYFRKEGWFCTADKDFEYTLRVSISQEESQKLSQRMQWGMEKLHESGGWNSTAPFGYNIEKAFLKINEEQAVTVRLIYDLFLSQKYGIGKICRYLNENNVKTQKGAKWSQPQVVRVLENKIYTGEQRTGTVKNIDITRNIKQKVDEDKHIVHQFEHLRVISDETYAKVQLERRKRLERINTGTYNTDRYTFSTICYCSYCGSVYKRKKRKAYCRKDGTSKDLGYEWTCTYNDMYGKSRCGHRLAISDADLLKAFKRELTARKKDNLEDLYEQFIAVRAKDIDIDIDEVNERLCKTKKLAKQLRSDYVDKLIDKDTYIEEMQEYTKEINGYTSDIQRYKQKNEYMKSLKLEFQSYQEMIANLDIEHIDNRMLKTLFYKVFLSYREMNGKKVAYAHYIYNFMDVTDKDIFDSMDIDGTTIVWHPIIEQ